MTPIVTVRRKCRRCGIIARLDRCGYCWLCQYWQAYGTEYINWELFSADWPARGWRWGKGAA
jgi:hypothetical protein